MSILKKKDLAKQFELVVQQEIKNHNSSILATNQSINEMSLKIDKMFDCFTQHKVQVDAWFRRTQEEFLNLERDVYKKITQNKIKIDIQKDSLEETSNYIWKEFDKIDANFVNSLEFKDFSDSILIELNGCKKTLFDQNEYVHAAICTIKNDLDRAMSCFTKEIEDKPDKSWEIKADLERKIQSYNIDTQGILKEINVYKKEAHIINKKIENIYTLIKRLSKKLSGDVCRNQDL